MKNSTRFQANEKIQSLFAEVVKAELGTYGKVSFHILSNTIKHFAEMPGFNQFALEYWHTVCSVHGIKYSI